MNLNIDSEILVKAINNLKEVLLKLKYSFCDFTEKLMNFHNAFFIRKSDLTLRFYYNMAIKIIKHNRKFGFCGKFHSRKKFLLMKKRAKRFLKFIDKVYGKHPSFLDGNLTWLNRNNRCYGINRLKNNIEKFNNIWYGEFDHPKTN